MKRTFLVTGGAGFIGSHIAEGLVERGEEVRVIDNFLTGKRENISHLFEKIEFIEGDIRDFDTCQRAVEGIDYVLHQAALPSVPRSIATPALTNEINVSGTLNMLLAARDAGVKKFVFASSSSVYGDEPILPKKEGKEGTPLSPYALTKFVGEQYCQIFSQIYDMPTICLRYFNVFGPRQDPDSQYAAVVPSFITKILQGESPIIFGDGEQSRDFTYVTNVVDGNLLAVEAQDISGEIINLACGENTSVNFLFESVRQILQKDIKPKYDEPRAGDVRHSFADIAKAEKMIKFTPRIALVEGLKKTIHWYQGRK